MAKRPKSKLTTGHYTGIGRIASRWAFLEMRMIEAIRSFLNIPTSDAMILFWHMGYNDRKDRLWSLFLLKEPDDRTKKHFNSLIGRLDDAYEIRNLAAHSVWSMGDKPGDITPTVIKAKGGQIKVSGHHLKQEQFSAQRLKSEAQKIDRLREDFEDFFARNFGATFDAPTTRESAMNRAQ